MAFKSFKEESRVNYGRDFCGDKNQNANRDELQVGALLRIADAVEKMAASYDKLRNDLDMYKRWNEQNKAAKEQLRRHAAGLRGTITRMKKQMKKGR